MDHRSDQLNEPSKVSNDHVHSSKQGEFAVIIPAYNEEATIHDVASRALAYTPLVIVVDDGSTDQTVAHLEDLPVTLIKNALNSGKAASLWKGIQAARQHDVRYIISLDGDGQHAPEDIPRLLAMSEDKPQHIIIGARLADKSVIPAKRYYANRVANFWLAWAAGYPISDSQSGFRVYPSELFDGLEMPTRKRDSFVFESEILIKAARRGIECTAVAIPAVYAENARPSHFRGVRDITLITLMVGRSLITRGFYPLGLYRSCIKPYLFPQHDK
ncbi:MAG: glycosyltransferase family 2 protein [Gammaproteobacteria bacterium]|nr:glycosyltransferase family 2 protein [Gammaproteobacteria bacterium]